jgi:undecaprenyl-diphosphatase
MELLIAALVLGLVEGLTEFLPISSTGHLVLSAEVLDFHGRRKELFLVFIQLGAILSVVWEYRGRLNRAAVEFPRPRSRRFLTRVFLAFLPSAVVGLVFADTITRVLFSPATVALALIVGGILILVVEALPLRVSTENAEDIGWRQALGVGAAQCAALWPGFSRSAATILGGMVSGLGRRAATEFSFFLAIPTMFAASFYKLFENVRWIRPADAAALGLSFAVAFVVALLSVRWLLRFVSTHTFRSFAWYRLALGGVILWLVYSGRM